MDVNENLRKDGFSPAVKVILLFGVISLLGDMVYETARSANSQYVQLLSISAAQVGLVFGLGEFVGYFLRLLAGVVADRTGKQWLFMFVGYGMLLAVPLMGFVQKWPFLVVLIFMERLGKALRNPSKDTVLSSVAEGQVGVGFAFGLQEALDQVGAALGPLIFTAVFYWTGKQGLAEYQTGYRLLLLPFAALMAFLVFAYRRVKKERLIPKMKTRAFQTERLQKVFWQYTLFTLVCTAGFANFSVIGYHMRATGMFEDGEITSLYAIAMGVDAGAALIIGRMYDRVKKTSGKKTGGILVMAGIPVLTMAMPFLALSHSRLLVVMGMVVFGVVMGAHETVMRSAIADLTPYSKRGTGYGVFNGAYGLALMIGASLMGVLYGRNLVWVIAGMTVLLEVLALFVFYRLYRTIQNT